MTLTSSWIEPANDEPSCPLPTGAHLATLGTNGSCRSSGSAPARSLDCGYGSGPSQGTGHDGLSPGAILRAPWRAT